MLRHVHSGMHTHLRSMSPRVPSICSCRWLMSRCVTPLGCFDRPRVTFSRGLLAFAAGLTATWPMNNMRSIAVQQSARLTCTPVRILMPFLKRQIRRPWFAWAQARNAPCRGHVDDRQTFPAPLREVMSVLPYQEKSQHRLTGELCTRYPCTSRNAEKVVPGNRTGLTIWNLLAWHADAMPRGKSVKVEVVRVYSCV